MKAKVKTRERRGEGKAREETSQKERCAVTMGADQGAWKAWLWRCAGRLQVGSRPSRIGKRRCSLHQSDGQTIEAKNAAPRRNWHPFSGWSWHVS